MGVNAKENRRGAERAGASGSSDTAPSIVYVPRPDATAEQEIAALAAAYRFILERHEGKQGTDPGGGSTGRPEGSPEDRPAEDESGQHAYEA